MNSASEGDAEVTPRLGGPDRPADAKRVQRTASGALLHRAAEVLGLDALARSLGLSAAVLEQLLQTNRTLSLPQQRILALAVLAMSDGHPELRRRAISLLGQVRAAIDFQDGVTETHASPPRSSRW